MKYNHPITNRIADTLNAEKARSAWSRGVNDYSFGLLDELEDAIEFERRLPDPAEVERWMLNGARSWMEYSWNGCALCYDGDIARRLCTPSELRKTRNGKRRPNAQEEWLDTQARALHQAAKRVCNAYAAAYSAAHVATAAD